MHPFPGPSPCPSPGHHLVTTWPSPYPSPCPSPGHHPAIALGIACPLSRAHPGIIRASPGHHPSITCLSPAAPIQHFAYFSGRLGIFPATSVRHSCITRAFLPAAPIQHFAKLSPAGSAVQCIRGVCAGPPCAVVELVETPADQFSHPEGRGFPDIHSLPEVPSLLQRPLWHLSFPVGSVFRIFHSLLARSAFSRTAPLPYWTAEPASPSSRLPGCTPAHLPAHPPACSSTCLFTADNPYFQTVVNRLCLSLPCNGSTLASAHFEKGLVRPHPQHRPLYGIML